jgi:hypothetical protein
MRGERQLCSVQRTPQARQPRGEAEQPAAIDHAGGSQRFAHRRGVAMRHHHRQRMVQRARAVQAMPQGSVAGRDGAARQQRQPSQDQRDAAAAAQGSRCVVRKRGR